LRNYLGLRELVFCLVVIGCEEAGVGKIEMDEGKEEVGEEGD
jgi:hypothetical protein